MCTEEKEGAGQEIEATFVIVRIILSSIFWKRNGIHI
jgi:hypothetical protein